MIRSEDWTTCSRNWPGHNMNRQTWMKDGGRQAGPRCCLEIACNATVASWRRPKVLLHESNFELLGHENNEIDQNKNQKNTMIETPAGKANL
jgi:hypothetical protein